MVSGGKNPKDKPKSETEVVVSASPGHYVFKKMLKPGIAIVGAAVIAAIIFVLFHKSSKPQTTNHSQNSISRACSTSGKNSIVAQALGDFAKNSLALQQKLAQQIKSLPKYQQDPNCLYILATFYMNSFDTSNASNYLNKLNKLYPEHKNSLNEFLSSYKSVADLNSEFSTLQKTIKQDQSNVLYTSLPESAVKK